jgi:hypothetical protein
MKAHEAVHRRNDGEGGVDRLGNPRAIASPRGDFDQRAEQGARAADFDWFRS